MKLYYRPGACSQAVHIALQWSGLPYEAEQAERGGAFLSINPNNQVPVLVENGQVLTQGPALLKYIAAKAPTAKIGSDGTPEGAYEIDRWLNFLGGDLHPTFWGAFAAPRLTTATDEAAHNAIKAAASAKVEALMDKIDGHLKDRTYVVGDHKTVVDALLFAISGWLGAANLSLDSFPNIKRHNETLKADADVQKVLAKEFQAA